MKPNNLLYFISYSLLFLSCSSHLPEEDQVNSDIKIIVKRKYQNVVRFELKERFTIYNNPDEVGCVVELYTDKSDTIDIRMLYKYSIDEIWVLNSWSKVVNNPLTQK